jgi:beta-phosphoglucomutase-like phosphatase (HAD superfamily)
MYMLDTVMIDWESTFVPTAAARREALARALHDERLASIPDDDAPLADLIAVRASRHFAERLGKGITLEPGTREFVERIQIGARLAIVTNATRAETEFVLGLAGLDGAASTIVTADDRAANPYQLALEHLSSRRPVRAEYSVAVANGAGMIHAARCASLRTIAIAAPAHVAVDADGAIEHIDGITLGDLARVAGLTTAPRHP